MRTRLVISLALVAVLALAGTQALGGQAAPQEIKRLSHTHPDGTNYSWFCGKLRGKPGEEYTVLANGAGVPDPKQKVTMNDRGRARAKFKILAAGYKEMVLKKGRKTIDRKSYSVPHGSRAPVHGPFPCV